MDRFGLVGMVLTAILVGCGEDGKGRGAAPPPPLPEPDPAPGFSLITPVAINPMSYKLPERPSCLRKSRDQRVPEAPQGVAIDGDLTDWATTIAWLDDPVGDAPAGFDVAQGYVARRGEDLLLAVAVAPAADSALHFELGGVISRQGALQRIVRRQIRWQSGRLEEEIGTGDWQLIDRAQAEISVSAGGAELRLGSRMLGDVTSWPLWWVRAEVRKAGERAESRMVDSTSAAYFPSIQSPDTLPYKLSVCDLWAGRQLAVPMVEIRDTAASPQGANVEQVSESAEQLSRSAFDAVNEILGQGTLPLSRLAVQTSFAEIPSGNAASFEDDPREWHRGIVISAQHLSPGVAQDFPEGPIFETLVSHYVALKLFQLNPSASAVIRSAVRTALKELVIREKLGPAYWLDARYRGAAERSAILGHVLANRFSPRTLLDAWRIAANSGDPDTEAAFKQALATSAADATAVNALWEKGAAALLDSDLDGLSDDFELANGTDPAKFDADGDGWSDGAELASGTEPSSRGRAPNKLMPDGTFDDWLELLPKRVFVDRGRTGRCPKAADINFFAALTTRDELMIGAVAAEFWEAEPRAKWEAVLDFPQQNRQLLVTAQSGSYELNVKDVGTDSLLRIFRRGTPIGRKTIEWVMSRQAFGIESYFDTKDAVKIRLRTVFKDGEEDVFCDETDWFSPYVSQPDS